MRRLNNFILTVWVLLLSACVVEAQQYRVTSLSLAEGLSQSSVYAIVQDQKGFTWLATQDGLNKYDGISFKVYREEPFDTLSVSSGNISALYCDDKGRLWVGTANGGLNLYLAEKDQFRHFYHGKPTEPGRIVNSITGDKSGNIWVGTDNGLFYIGADLNPKHIPLLEDNTDTVPDKFVNTVFCDHNGDIWAGTFMGLFKVTTGKQPEASFFRLSEDKDVVIAVCQDRQQRYWIGTQKGIYVLSEQNRPLTFVGSDNCPLMRNSGVSQLLAVSTGKIWVGFNDGGLHLAGLDQDNHIICEEVRVHDSKSFSGGSEILSLYEDKITPGLVWAGFRASGFKRFAPVTKKFITDKLADQGIPTPFVTSIFKDKNNVIWIATANGLIRKDAIQNKYTLIRPLEKGRTKNEINYIGGVAPDQHGDVFFCSGNKVYKSNNGNGNWEQVAFETPMNAYIRTISNAGDGSVFAITKYNIYRYDAAKNAFISYLRITDNDRLRDVGFYLSCMLIDRHDNLWVGTSTGLDFYPSGKGLTKPVTFLHHRDDSLSLRNQTILTLFEDRSGNIWTGTMNGLSKTVTNGDKIYFLNYSTRNGLSNNVVYSIIQNPGDNRLWLSTNNGITLFDPTGVKTSVFDVQDGIQSNEFNSYAASVAADGEIFFGGIDGYTSFFPQHIAADTTAPHVMITGITLGNGTFVPIEKAGMIDLKYKDNNFTVNFIGLQYVDPLKNVYSYKLEGFKDNWIPLEGAPNVNFSQLPPGKYTFRVKAANSDGVYSKADAMVVINLLPPFYKTVWFFLIILLFIGASLWGLHKYRLQMKLEQVREIEKLRKATAADFHDELGHKLTVISWFAEILKRKMGNQQAELNSHLDKIIETSGNLYHTMKDMLWAMDPDKDSVFELYNQIREFGQGLFDETGVMFESGEIPETMKDRMVSPAQRRHVLLIFKEVMHNALKHSGGTDTKLAMKADDKSVIFEFRDNGSGFRMNGQNVGHGLNNVKRRAAMINSEITIYSEGSGTLATLTLPLSA